MSTRSLFQIGPYDVIAELGRDPLGASYLCRDPADDALFEVTHISEWLGNNSQFCEAFDRARPAMALVDPHLLTLRSGAFSHGGYLAHPYLEGATLADLLAIGACEPALLARILADVLSGLASAHDRGFLHLHLSPERIVIGRDGVARISELGLAGARGIAQPGITPYTAPRIEGDPPDPRFDVFAIGAIAWSAITGHALFAGRGESGTRERLLGLPIPPPSEVGARPPAAWDAPVLRALARDPAERYASARDFATAISTVTEPATRAELGLWVESTFATAFARRREATIALDPTEVQVCPLRESERVRPPRADTGNARAVGFLAAAFAAGTTFAFLLP